MPPKAKKALTAGSKELYYEDQQLADDIVILEEKLKGLKRVYLDRMTALAERKQQELVLSAELDARKAGLEAKKSEKIDVLTDGTRVYKVRERIALQEIATQDAALHELQETKKKLQEQLETCTADFDSRIKSKKREFESLRERTADMEKEFAVLLSDVEQCSP
ncbi:conserved hypothetical protein [Leishmania major strain Friedlin]|uniref:Dynein regulatory complex protein 12 n=1 Tax=Leishmania major TaxID=5664 RepID=Q4QA99_LEIMA|nr:conserved hypothetical protein [Leishmania major strain Friedlin]CAG9574749.1 hypothetical_protein_-_conserved [Leishmania major strain Friedlin]CAJ05426.1 conserved hypothetical protein [Leishmania major strain Friedlin]|eukprot:XP_001683749.1 conserved hypothetical protein [Leishmania major strain Friedlin]